MENREPSNYLCLSYYRSNLQSDLAGIETISSIGKPLFVVPLTLPVHERSTSQRKVQVSSLCSVCYPQPSLHGTACSMFACSHPVKVSTPRNHHTAWHPIITHLLVSIGLKLQKRGTALELPLHPHRQVLPLERMVSFIDDSDFPSLPADGPINYPHIIDIATFDYLHEIHEYEEPALSGLTLWDAVVTLLHTKAPAHLHDLLDLDKEEVKTIVGDERWADKVVIWRRRGDVLVSHTHTHTHTHTPNHT